MGQSKERPLVALSAGREEASHQPGGWTQLLGPHPQPGHPRGSATHHGWPCPQPVGQAPTMQLPPKAATFPLCGWDRPLQVATLLTVPT